MLDQRQDRLDRAGRLQSGGAQERRSQYIQGSRLLHEAPQARLDLQIVRLHGAVDRVGAEDAQHRRQLAQFRRRGFADVEVVVAELAHEVGGAGAVGVGRREPREVPDDARRVGLDSASAQHLGVRIVGLREDE